MKVENDQQTEIDYLYKLYTQEALKNIDQKALLYLGTYTRTGEESYSIYQIQEATSPGNYSSINQVFDFKIEKSYYITLPDDSVYYFGFQTQRLNSFKDYSILDEEIYLTITKDNIIIGSVKAKIVYPDKGTGSISSEGVTSYPVYSTSGVLKDVKSVEIQFFSDLSRKVYFYGNVPEI